MPRRIRLRRTEPTTAGRKPADGALPHGGRLVSRLAHGPSRLRLMERARRAPRIRLGPCEAADLELLAVGAYSPLTGFMTRAEYQRVVAEMRLPSGLVWSLPITLTVSRETARSLREGHDVALVDRTETIVGLLELAETFTASPEREARLVYRTTDRNHPGVQSLFQREAVLLGGAIHLLERPRPRDFPECRLDPSDTRRTFAEKGWRTVVGFQTRNPIHRAHEYIQKCALETVDGLLIHPLVGETKDDDIPASVRMRCYKLLLDRYYPKDRIVLAVLPAAMRYAGPREAIFHALVRKNYGCTHFIVGRDHAGAGNYYGPFDAQAIFREFRPEELGITPLFFDAAFWCRICGTMVSAKTCPHPGSEHVDLSGTKVRAMLRAGETPPPEFTRPEIAQVLLDASR